MTPEIQVVYVEASELIPSEYNPRQASDKEVKDLRESISRFGLVDPILVNSAENRKNIVIGGHFRLRIASDLGIGRVPVVYINIPDIEMEKELNLRLNKNSGSWDWDLLANFDQSLLSNAGFSRDEMQKIFNLDASEDGFDAEAEYGRISEAETKLGDVYLLGQHRLVCGDSTDFATVSKLMGEDRADLVFTDPPYNVNYSYAKYEFVKGKKRKKKDDGKIFNDNQTADSFYKFLLDCFTNIYTFSKNSACLYVCYSTSTQAMFFNAFHEAGFHFSQMIIWLKERILLGLGQDYHRCYEPIMFGWKEGEIRYTNKTINKEKEAWDLDRLAFEERLDLWFIHRDKASEYEHPTQKPVRLAERAIKKNCPVGGLLFEPFGGSGSTLVAAHQLGRRCFCLELDPKYCDVIKLRYERLTGEKAVLVGQAELSVVASGV